MIGMIGTNHRRASLRLREQLGLKMTQYHHGVCDAIPCVLLHTCNRVEWYFSSEEPTNIHEAVISHIRESLSDEDVCSLYTFFGDECFSHLVQVASGMDSLFVGETEIQCQVKQAYLEAVKSQPLCKELHFLFQRALHRAKEIRTVATCRNTQTLTKLVVEYLLGYIERRHDKKLLFIGTSMINRSIASAIAPRVPSLTIANRTPSRAEEVAQVLGAAVLPWDQLSELWCAYDCVVTATRSHEWILRDHSSILPKHQVLIDLAVPRNIDPMLTAKGRQVLNIESFVPSCIFSFS